MKLSSNSKQAPVFYYNPSLIFQKFYFNPHKIFILQYFYKDSSYLCVSNHILWQKYDYKEKNKNQHRSHSMADKGKSCGF